MFLKESLDMLWWVVVGLRTVDMTLPECSVSMCINPPALPTLNLSSTQSELGPKQAQAEYKGSLVLPTLEGTAPLKANINYNKKLEETNLKPLSKKKKKHVAGLQQDLSLSGECHHCPLCEPSCLTALRSICASSKVRRIHCIYFTQI